MFYGFIAAMAGIVYAAIGITLIVLLLKLI